MIFSELKKKLNEEGLKPIYFIYGKDDYLRNSAINMIVSRAVTNMKELNFDSFDTNFNENEIFYKSNTLPFMSEKRVVLLKEYYPKELGENFKKYFASPNTDCVFVISNLEKCDAISKHRNVEQVTCDKMDASLVRKWVVSAFNKQNLKVTTSAVDLLVKYTLSNFSLMQAEIDKLGSYKTDDVVTEADIEKVVSKCEEFAFYECVNYVLDKNMPMAMDSMNFILRDKTKSQPLFISLYNNVRIMLYIKVNKLGKDELVSKFKVLPFVAPKLINQSKNFSPLKLVDAVKLAYELDGKIKNGKIDVQDAIINFITFLIK